MINLWIIDIEYAKLLIIKTHYSIYTFVNLENIYSTSGKENMTAPG